MLLQLQRAIASLLANIGEAASCFSAGDRRRYFDYAYRSAGEAGALLLAFHAIGALTTDEYGALRTLVERIQQMLMRLMQRSLQNPKAPPARIALRYRIYRLRSSSSRTLRRRSLTAAPSMWTTSGPESGRS
jgi:four helix bundle protein